MDVNRLVIESVTTCFLVGVFCQLARFLYRTSQINFLVYLLTKLLICTLVICAVYYLKKGKDIGELGLLIFGALLGLWTES